MSENVYKELFEANKKRAYAEYYHGNCRQTICSNRY